MAKALRTPHSADNLVTRHSVTEHFESMAAATAVRHHIRPNIFMNHSPLIPCMIGIPRRLTSLGILSLFPGEVGAQLRFGVKA